MPAIICSGAIKDKVPTNLKCLEISTLRPKTNLQSIYIQGEVVKRYKLFDNKADPPLLKIDIKDSKNPDRVHYFFAFGQVASDLDVCSAGDTLVFMKFEIEKCPGHYDKDYQIIADDRGKLESLVWIFKQEKQDTNTASVATRQLTKPLSPKLKYNYKPLSSLEVNTIVDVYGVVKFFKPPVPTKGRDYMYILSLTDESLENPDDKIKCNIFCKDPENVPKYEVGDIVRFHRLKVQSYQGSKQGYNGPAFQWLMFHESLDNCQSSCPTYTFEQQDRDRVQALLEWWSQSGKCIDNETKTLSQVQIKSYFNLVCQVIRVCDVPSETCKLLTVWDGTKFEGPLKKAEEEKFDETVLEDENLMTASKGYAVDVFLYDNHADSSVVIRPGNYILLVNLHAAVVSGLVELTLHTGTSFGRRLEVLYDGSPHALKLKAVLDPLVDKGNNLKDVSADKECSSKDSLINKGHNSKDNLDKGHHSKDDSRDKGGNSKDDKGQNSKDDLVDQAHNTKNDLVDKGSNSNDSADKAHISNNDSVKNGCHLMDIAPKGCNSKDSVDKGHNSNGNSSHVQSQKGIPMKTQHRKREREKQKDDEIPSKMPVTDINTDAAEILNNTNNNQQNIEEIDAEAIIVVESSDDSLSQSILHPTTSKYEAQSPSVLLPATPKADADTSSKDSDCVVVEDGGEMGKECVALGASAEADSRVIAADRVIPADSRVIPADNRVISGGSRVIPADSRAIPADSRVIPADSRVITADNSNRQNKDITPGQAAESVLTDGRNQEVATHDVAGSNLVLQTSLPQHEEDEDSSILLSSASVCLSAEEDSGNVVPAERLVEANGNHDIPHVVGANGSQDITYPHVVGANGNQNTTYPHVVGANVNQNTTYQHVVGANGNQNTTYPHVVGANVNQNTTYPHVVGANGNQNTTYPHVVVAKCNQDIAYAQVADANGNENTTNPHVVCVNGNESNIPSIVGNKQDNTCLSFSNDFPLHEDLAHQSSEVDDSESYTTAPSPGHSQSTQESALDFGQTYTVEEACSYLQQEAQRQAGLYLVESGSYLTHDPQSEAGSYLTHDPQSEAGLYLCHEQSETGSYLGHESHSETGLYLSHDSQGGTGSFLVHSSQSDTESYLGHDSQSQTRSYLGHDPQTEAGLYLTHESQREAGSYYGHAAQGEAASQNLYSPHDIHMLNSFQLNFDSASFSQGAHHEYQTMAPDHFTPGTVVQGSSESDHENAARCMLKTASIIRDHPHVPISTLQQVLSAGEMSKFRVQARVADYSPKPTCATDIVHLLCFACFQAESASQSLTWSQTNQLYCSECSSVPRPLKPTIIIKFILTDGHNSIEASLWDKNAVQFFKGICPQDILSDAQSFHSIQRSLIDLCPPGSRLEERPLLECCVLAYQSQGSMVYQIFDTVLV
ncbi:uncharacterized protein LOC131938732 [Physella acuta]|uniref:uncharacterized protein LOC131938732 n=1 Tax=Physella acuta TaxID=109671 RepID=UPI0027DCAA2D|nr:uncharacterized protein LOC131938732 [Physella acuta]